MDAGAVPQRARDGRLRDAGALGDVERCRTQHLSGHPCLVSFQRDLLTRRRGLSIRGGIGPARSEEHTSELQSLMRNSSAVFCLNKKTYNQQMTYIHHYNTNRNTT